MVLLLEIQKFPTLLNIRGDVLRSISRTTACNSTENVTTMLTYGYRYVVKLVGIIADSNVKKVFA